MKTTSIQKDTATMKLKDVTDNELYVVLTCGNEQFVGNVFCMSAPERVFNLSQFREYDAINMDPQNTDVRKLAVGSEIVIKVS